MAIRRAAPVAKLERKVGPEISCNLIDIPRRQWLFCTSTYDLSEFLGVSSPSCRRDRSVRITMPWRQSLNWFENFRQKISHEFSPRLFQE